MRKNLMILYKRDINQKLLCVRISFLILGTGCFFSFTNNVSSLGYLLAFTVFIMSTIVINDLRVLSDSFDISKYYFFGFIKREKRFEKFKTINSRPLGRDFGEYGEFVVEDPSSSGIGCLFSLFFNVLSPKIVKKEFYIEMLDTDNSVIESAYILLDIKEYAFLKDFLLKQQ